MAGATVLDRLHALALRLVLGKDLAQQRAALPERGFLPELPAHQAPAGRAEWKALPGQVIELGATGFQIVMNTGPSMPLYMLRAPEGWLVYSCADLPALKQLGERFAAEREEFVCKPQVQKW